jgi:hypothetical protein
MEKMEKNCKNYLKLFKIAQTGLLEQFLSSSALSVS